MRSISSFRPSATGTASIAASTTSNRVALVGTTLQTRAWVAAGSPPTFIEFGSSTVTAALTTGLPMAIGVNEVLTIPQGQTFAAAITSSGTSTAFFSAGEGV